MPTDTAPSPAVRNIQEIVALEETELCRRPTVLEAGTRALQLRDAAAFRLTRAV